MEIKQVLDNLKRAEDEIETYRGMNTHTQELCERVGYTGDAIERMERYTNNRIQATHDEVSYWGNQLNELDDTKAEILRMRFLYGLTVEQVADELFYSVKHIYTLTKQAINELEEKHAHSKGYKGQFDN